MSQFDHVLNHHPVASSYPSAVSPARKQQLPAFKALAAAATAESSADDVDMSRSGVPVTPAVSDYRTTIHFLTSPSTSSEATISFNTAADCAMDIDSKASPDLSSMPVSALLQSDDTIHGQHAPFQKSSSSSPPRHANLSLPPIRVSESAASSTQYRDDELTGMAGLMELAGPDSETSRYPRGYAQGPAGMHHQQQHQQHQQYLGSRGEAYSSSNSSNSTASYSVPPALNIANRSSPSSYTVPRAYTMPGQQLYPSPQQHSYQQQPFYQPPQQLHQQSQQHLSQQQQQPPRFTLHHSTNSVGSPMSAGQAMRTPDSLPSGNMHKTTQSFPAVIDDLRTSRRRAQSTDSMHSSQYGSGPSALPCVLGNANIRNRAYTQAQRQRTNDTPLFPILLHRIINDPKNESWIRWCDDGKAFKFSSADNLLACLQAAGLRAQNYHSIEKNLNDYRFTRLTDQRRKLPDRNGVLWWMFSHPQFLRSNPEGIVNIQRRRRTNPPAASPQPAVHPPQPQLPHSTQSSINLQSQGSYSLPPSASSTHQGQY
ncbi:Heat shock transcription factor [Coemansia sp. RSA 485]|nr:Heat shock transcription factor [Coemansia sp. RSA 485]